MADDSSVFPLVLAIREDGSVAGALDGFEQQILGATSRAAGGFQGLRRQVDELRQSTAQKIADPLGIQASLRALSTSPLQRALSEQASAQNALAEQQRRATAERIAGIQREFDAAMGAIRAEQSARQQAIAQTRRDMDTFAALQQQRASEAARLVAGPQQQPAQLYFDPRGSEQAAASARAQAAAFAVVAREAEQLAAATATATAADRAFAIQARETATAAAIEADRLEQVAATQARVAAAVVASGAQAIQSTDLLANSVRGQRLATLQASQQLQDFFIQVQGGTSVLVALSQQGSQLAFVMAQAGGETGKFARFMAGGWGTGIFAGIAVLSILVGWLGTHKTAQDESAKAADRMAERERNLSRFIDLTTGRIKEQNQALIINQALKAEKDVEETAKAYRSARAGLLARRTTDAPTLVPTGMAEAQFTGLDPRFNAALDRYARGGGTSRLAQDLQRIGREAPALRETANELIRLTARVTDAARADQQARAIRRTQAGDTSEANLRIARGDFSPPTAETAQLRAQAQVAAADEGTAALRAATGRRRAALLALDREFKVKGGVVPEAQAGAYQARATAIEAAYNKEKAAAEAANKARSEAASTAQRVAGQRRQELFADAKAIGDGTDAIKAANSLYDAEITRLRNQLREGLISEETAREAAVRARQVRNAAVDAAQGAQKLDEALQSISQEFDGDSRFVNRIEKAQRAVADAIKRIDPLTGAAKIGEREYTREQLTGLQSSLDDAYLRPITQAKEQLEQQAQIQAALLAGNEDEADFLRMKFQLLSQFGELSAAERAALEARLAPLRDAITAEKDRTAEIERRTLLINSQANAARRVQDAFTGFLANPFGKDAVKDLGQNLTRARQQAIAEQLSIKLFGGDLGSRVYDALTRGSRPLATAADRHVAAAAALTQAAGALTASARAANDNAPSLAQQVTTPSAFGLGAVRAGVPAAVPALPGDVTVEGPRASRPLIDGQLGVGLEVAGLGLLDVSEQLAAAEANRNRQEARQQAATIALSYAAQAIGGKGGAALNSLINANATVGLGEDIASGLASKLGGSGKVGFANGGGLAGAAGGAVGGLGIGMASSSILSLLGVKGTGTGSAIGGAIGGAAFGPLGAIGGSLVGGLIGSMFYKPKPGGATVSNIGGSAGIGGSVGSDRSGIAAGNDLGGQVASALNSIVQQLGAELGSFSVQIGKYKDDFRVNVNGRPLGGVKGSGAVGFGDNAQAAVAYAIQTAIAQGAVAGLRAGTQRLIQIGGDVDRQLQKALSFEGVFTELKQLKDPIGAAKDAIDKQLKNLRAIFTEAGATAEETAQLEELYALKRAEVVKQAQQQAIGQLQDLLDNLMFKGDTGLSLRTREQNAMANLSPLIAQIQAGKPVDQAAYTQAAQIYLDIQRQLYGSTTRYFDTLSTITGLTKQAIGNAGAGNVTSISDAVTKAADAAAAAAQASTNAFSIPQDRVAMMTAGQFSGAVSAGMSGVEQRLDANFAAQTRAIVQAINAGAASAGDATDSGLQMIMALRNA